MSIQGIEGATAGEVSLAEVIAEAKKESDYIDAVSRVTGIGESSPSAVKEAVELADSGDRISALRRISGAKLSGSSASAARSDGLIGNAQVGVIEVTRRVSGTSVAIIEANQMAGHKEKKQVELAVKADDKRDFGLGDVEWHLLTQAEIFAKLGSRLEGITSAEAAELLKKHGPNRITPPPVTHWFIKFL